ncbi:2-oxoglutarate and iron-dependent oxygenase domain-containing protein [Algiphilus sp. W345]|uniref:2-oxoglutarate-dependent ethylene/succinate-forming enzyme n=1 Tax=Banduia mediterranea TaxID=3075609 RepID=A0ABU2WJR7_9GAMM|nr:2-oxoglutarate and iron-dependent oxygenase domain-containing protein [Algiphilus sp. W345]MDT0498128.1 2-oxoglutarate and iron-dependent oxygenase domain-containing protein [Algiphilus sp. W345]
MKFHVPLIDIAPYANDGEDSLARADTAEALAQACREVGFVQILGHGVPDSVLAALASAMDGFFSQPSEYKRCYRAAPEINRGYAPPHSESLSLSLGIGTPAAADYFEAFNVGTAASDFPGLELPAQVYAENLWPQPVAGFDDRQFRGAVETYFAEAGRVARILTRIFADALGVDAGVFERVSDHSVDVLRMNHYALPPGTAADGPDPVGMGAHTDYGIVTVLWADPVPGLQVLGGDSVWHDVQPAPGALLVNLGDLTARWTHDRWRSTLHRVIPPVVDGRIVRRRSAAYFHDGNIDARIETIPSCLAAGEAAYPPITVGEHLAAKLAGSRAGQPNREAGSEAERLRAARDD